MNERDELVIEAILGDNINWTDGDTGSATDAILTHFQRRPRTITTVDDLYALPSGSILLSQSEYPRYTGTVWRVSGLGMIERVGREVDGVTPLRYFKDPLPVTVLHEPEPLP